MYDFFITFVGRLNTWESVRACLEISPARICMYVPRSVDHRHSIRLAACVDHPSVFTSFLHVH
jgi:hypothetical protein